MGSIKEGRLFLEAGPWNRWDTIPRDQQKGVPCPPLEKPAPSGVEKIALVSPNEISLGSIKLIDAIVGRVSHRKFTEQSLTLQELSFLLWATQGVKEVWPDGVVGKRTVPSAGSRHPFETYLLVYRVEGVKQGLYRYLALSHELYLVREMDENIPDEWYMKNCAVTFIWTVIPYRTEWRYATFSHKVIALDAGHVCQNLYLACEAIGAGTCAIGAYNQDDIDQYLGIDTAEEQTIYIAPVGKVHGSKKG